jgi:hypothetical protein
MSVGAESFKLPSLSLVHMPSHRARQLLDQADTLVPLADASGRAMIDAAARAAEATESAAAAAAAAAAQVGQLRAGALLGGSWGGGEAAGRSRSGGWLRGAAGASSAAGGSWER